MGAGKNLLTKEDNERYEKMCVENLGEECTRWLNTGEM